MGVLAIPVLSLIAGTAEKDHSHYSSEVQLAVSAFRAAFLAYQKSRSYNLKESAYRLDSVQTAWDNLARARIAETGCGFYMTPKQYQQARNEHTG
jgi:hypothetical protein